MVFDVSDIIDSIEVRYEKIKNSLDGLSLSKQLDFFIDYIVELEIKGIKPSAQLHIINKIFAEQITYRQYQYYWKKNINQIKKGESSEESDSASKKSLLEPKSNKDLKNNNKIVSDVEDQSQDKQIDFGIFDSLKINNKGKL